MNFHDDVPFEFEKITAPPFNDLDIDTHKVLVTFFADMQAQGQTPAEMPLPWLAEMIGHQTALSKMELPWLKLQSFGDKASDRLCLRNDANVLAISGIEIEHDAGEIAFETAIATMRQARIRCLLYTSPSWVEGVKEKWRILLPTSKQLPSEAHARLLPRANGVFGGKTSGECFTLSQAYLFGHLEGAAHREMVLDGDFIDLRDDLDAGAMGKQKHPTNGTDDGASSGGYSKEQLVDYILTGEVFHGSLLGLSAKLAASGMKEEAIIEYLQDLMTRSKAPTDQRWHARYDDIPRLTESAIAKYGRDLNKDWSKTLLGDWLRKWKETNADNGSYFNKPGTPPPPPLPPKPPVTNLMQTSAEFVGGYVPPDYLIDGLLQRRYVYSLTAPTGAGKTSVALRIAAHVANGTVLADREVEKGRVLFFAGENPDDVRTRWIMLCEEMKIDPDSMNVVFMPLTLDLSEQEIRDRIDLEAAHFGPFSLLIVDTSAAYYSGSDENDNVALGGHARMLRSFVGLPGGPTVLVTCHPTKTPNMENLLPRGGGAFLAEVDGNLVCIKDTSTMMVEVTTHGKFRGPDFAPFAFTLVAGQSDRLVDSKGRKVWSIFARPISSETQERIEENKNDAQDHVLYAMVKCPGLSLLKFAEKLRWNTMDGKPNKPRVHRHMKVLQKAPNKLVEQLRNGKYVLTAKGKKEADKVAAEMEGTDRVPDEWK